MRFDPAQRRLSAREWTGGIEAEIRFADGFPMLALSTASLGDLNRRLTTALPMNRFRPNIVLEGLEAYDEDRIDELRGDGVRLKLVKACTRCRITVTNQDSAEVEGDEPLRTLRGYRYDATPARRVLRPERDRPRGSGRYAKARPDPGNSMAQTPGAMTRTTATSRRARSRGPAGRAMRPGQETEPAGGRLLRI